MSQPTYTPKFQHKDWVDFVDPVQAGGTNGINNRFHALEAEFQAIKAVLDVLGQPPAPKPGTLSLAPTLAATTAPPWLQGVGFVTTPTVGQPPAAMAPSATGFMPVNLPDGATIQSLRVTGTTAGGTLSIILFSQPLTVVAQTPLISILNTFPNVSPAAAFDAKPSQNVSIVIDNTANKYFLVASLSNGNGALGAGGTTINAFQIPYTAP